ncbi:MAG TPA: Smr/MutS family protein [Gemmatimonadaceae bacterium]|nr:Smr/MutS family protein [Gemmatimonadaceae bacterium]
MAKLTDLKALLETRRASAPAAETPPSAKPGRHDDARPREVPARRAVAASKHAEGDVDIKAAFADVAPIKRANKARVHAAPPAPVPRHRIADEEDALAASKYGAEPAPHAWDIGQEHEGEQTFLRAGLGTDVLAKLRRSHWTVQAELDLHGHDSDEAHDALADFLDEARGAGMRCVRVIHGKGLTSPNREPVLKGKVRRWLARWDDVLAYCEAPRHAGGGGAVIVLLRGR